MVAKSYQSIRTGSAFDRRNFLKLGGAATAGIILGSPSAWAEGEKERPRPPKPKTNVGEATAVPRMTSSLPGPFPGRVVEINNPAAMIGDRIDASTVHAMFRQGIERLTGKPLAESFDILFEKDDVVGIKVNPVGAGLISTRHELVEAIIDWLTAGGVSRERIVIWDRFDSMLTDAGFTPERYPGVRMVGLQTMDENFSDEKGADASRWLDENGNHISADLWDKEVYYWADIEAPKDKNYLNQHVFNGKESNFGKLLTHELTKIINVPVLKNTGNGISVATKNIGYGAICNTGRLHQPLFFDVCTEVHAFPVIRDKLVLNVVDGLRAQYEGGPMPAAEFTYIYNSIFCATDPFAIDMVCHNLLVEKRKEVGIEVNEHPMFTEYLRYGERLGLGVVDPERLEHIRVQEGG